MRPEISEFSFGFAVVESLIRALPDGVQAAPLFPTQVSEGSTGGYDVRLDRPGGLIFLQFKRSDLMTRRSAIGSEDFHLPFYRFHLYSRMNYRQHQLLCELEKTSNSVYYCAPRLSRVDELNRAYLERTVLEKSIFFTPLSLSIDSLDEREHTVSYDRVSDFGVLRSTPVRVQASSVGELTRDIHSITSTRQTIKEGLYDWYRILAKLAEIHTNLPRPEFIELGDAKFLSEFARLCKIVIGCECIALWRP